ncbi:MAG: histidine kinase [Bacteroidota bacterium]
MRFFILLLCLLFYFIKTDCQEVTSTFVYYPLDQTLDLSNKLNAHFDIDNDGFFWTSSQDGLNRFNGESIKVFRPHITGRYLDKNITSKVYQDKNGNKWFTSNTALNCIFADTDSIKSWQLFEKNNSYYYAFHLEQDSLLWFVASQKLYKLNTTSIKTLDTICIGNFDAYIAYAIENDRGEVKRIIKPALEGDLGFEIIDVNNDTIIEKGAKYFDGSSKNKLSTRINFVSIESDSSYWIPSYVGLIHFNPYQPEEFQVYKHSQTETTPSYIDIASWRNRYLWLTSFGNGVLLFDKVSKEFIRQDTVFYLQNGTKKLKNLFRVFIDEKENLWLSTFNDGLLHTSLNNSKFSNLPNPQTISTKISIEALIETEKSGLSYLSSGTVFSKDLFLDQQMFIPNKFLNPNLKITKLVQDDNKDIWIIANKIWQWDSQNQRLNLIVSETSSIYDLIQRSDSLFWIFDDNNIYELNSNHSQRPLSSQKKITTDLHLPAQLLHDPLSNLAFLSQSDNILKVFKETTDTSLYDVGIINGLSSITKDTIWLASSTGLYLFNAKTLQAKKINHPSKKLDRSFTDVVADSLGKIWLSSYQGIYRYNPVNNTVDHFTQSDGLISMQYKKNVSLYGSDGLIYFGGDKGITVIDPKNVKLNPTPPTIKLMEVMVNNQVIDHRPFLKKGNHPQFKYTENSLDFKFAILEFSDPKRNKFRFNLIKNKRDTLRSGDNNPVEFNLLAPGKYRLELSAWNSDGTKTKNPEIIVFTINPPWYATWWFRTLAFILILSIIYAIYRNRIRQIKERETAKRQQAELKQLAAETETAVLRLQMNPHFIFNSMNSINSYLLKKDVATASDYLQRFSRLMRLILERSQQEFTDLEEEMELLTYYLDTEAMRLKKPLKYHFEIKDDLDPEDVLLPTMILQPFIENAIWHGISPKKEGGTIWIRFSKENELLHCEVEDDGVGRNFAQKTNPSIHKSKALEITNRRLELLSAQQVTQTKFEILDLIDDENAAKGTLVRVSIPFLV